MYIPIYLYIYYIIIYYIGTARKIQTSNNIILYLMMIYNYINNNYNIGIYNNTYYIHLLY